IDGTGRKLGLPPERVVLTVDKHANTCAASIPLALETAVSDGRIKRGDLLLLEGIGGGFARGASLVRWEGKHRLLQIPFERGENRRRYKRIGNLPAYDTFPIQD